MSIELYALLILISGLKLVPHPTESPVENNQDGASINANISNGIPASGDDPPISWNIKVE